MCTKNDQLCCLSPVPTALCCSRQCIWQCGWAVPGHIHSDLPPKSIFALVRVATSIHMTVMAALFGGTRKRRWSTNHCKGWGQQSFDRFLFGTSLSSMIEVKACSVFPLLCTCRPPPQGPPGYEAESWSSLRCPTRTTNTLAFSSPSVCTAASACRSGIATAACSLCGQTLDR